MKTGVSVKSRPRPSSAITQAAAASQLQHLQEALKLLPDPHLPAPFARYAPEALTNDGDQSLLDDTLFDRRLTLEMLAAMREASPAKRSRRP